MDLFEGLPEPVAERPVNQNSVDLFGDLLEPSAEKNAHPNDKTSKRPSLDNVDDSCDVSSRKHARLSNESVDQNDMKEVSEETKCNEIIQLRSYTATRKGERPEMQDRHKCIDDFSPYITVDKEQRWWNRLSFYGVYDGHAGSRASSYAAEHLHVRLAEEFPRLRPPDIDRSVKRTILEAYRRTDEEFLRAASRQRPHWRDGSTAVTALVVDNMIYVAHVGDSKAVLSRQALENRGTKAEWTPVTVTRDHSPQDYEERQRIQRCGASVRDGRVDGILEVSRSIGDYNMKKRGVIALPEVKKCIMDSLTPLLILACDGLWHTVPPPEAARLAAETYNKEEGGKFWLERASSRLAAEAVRRLSGDNVTVMLVAFEVPLVKTLTQTAPDAD